jgi:isocitrate/isopropylmalate dehydrogenase
LEEVQMATDGKISLVVLPGDGIGPEITEATVRVLRAAALSQRA